MERFKVFLAAASALTDLANPTGKQCPFCRQQLSSESVDLITKYHEFLTSRLEEEIRSLSDGIAASLRIFEQVLAYSLADPDPTAQIIPPGLKAAALDVMQKVKASLPHPLTPLASTDTHNYDSYRQLAPIATTVTREITRREQPLAEATADAVTRQAQRQRLAQAIAEYDFRAMFESQLANLRPLSQRLALYHAMQRWIAFWNLSNVLRQITNAASDAYGALVIAEFTRRLDAEYVALCGVPMARMGIVLRQHGHAQEVIINPQVGDHPIHRVLSEGERKIHALALFFSEVAVGSYDIVVFDDPVDSFDYNNAENYAQRLRNLLQQRPRLQVIILTHNWHCFVLLQLTMHKAGLTRELSVMLLENCTTVAEYSERVDALETEINSIFAQTGEPSTSAKEHLAGLLRRLIESVVNVHVFNDARHQYKQKSQPIADFDKFTKVVALTTAEASALRDLYSNLSPPEHDDPRNFYVSRTKAQYQHWYGEILGIKAALVARKP